MLEIDNLRTTAENLLLGDNAEINFEKYSYELNYSIDYAKQLLDLHEEFIDIYKYELRVRIALHYAPIKAINFDANSRKSRYSLILEYIQKNFIKDQDNAKKLANSVNIVLNNWDVDRNNQYTKHRDTLLIKQDYKCAHCKVLFQKTKYGYEAKSIFLNSDYKPYAEGDTTYIRPEVDHIQPISQNGQNSIDNLQVLCRLCNGAKSDLITLKTQNEILYAGYSLSDLRSVKTKHKPPQNKGVSHIHKMLYFSILSAKRKCNECGSNKNELIMRKKIVNGPFIRSNLTVICSRCLIEKYPIVPI